jgi:hypothetical protein
MSQDSAEWLDAQAEGAAAARKNLEELDQQMRALQKALALELAPEGERGLVTAVQEFEERIDLIGKWRATAIAAGADVAEANEKAAKMMQDAWDAALGKLTEKGDEVSDFFKRMTERIQDAVADGIFDVLQGNVKSWEDWGNSIKRVLDRVVADFLAAQLNTIILGPKTDQGQFGGLIGQLVSLGTSIFSGGAGAGTEALIASGAADTLVSGLGYHQGGPITADGRFASFRRSAFPVLHSGGEVPLIGQAGEFMIRKWSAERIGRSRLDYINETGMLPTDMMRSTGGRGGTTVNHFNFHGVQDMDSFRRSRAQLASDLSRAVRKGDKYN